MFNGRVDMSQGAQAALIRCVSIFGCRARVILVPGLGGCRRVQRRVAGKSPFARHLEVAITKKPRRSKPMAGGYVWEMIERERVSPLFLFLPRAIIKRTAALASLSR